jgi:hypothetical protein
MCKKKSAPFVAARARKAPCLEVLERGVSVFDDVFVFVAFLKMVYLKGVGAP